MRSPHLHLFAAIFAVLLLFLTFALPWTRSADAKPTETDFAPTLSAEVAAARVAAAQQAEAARLSLNRPANATNAAVLPNVPIVYFPQTGHHLSNRSGFLDFWRSQGQMLLFGYPLTEEIEENGRIVQYFERARLEYHPEAVGTGEQVQLGLIGSEAMAGRVFDPAQPADNARFFPETQHNIYGKFRVFWEKRGGIARFGFPISEEMDEVSPMDGQVRRTQYFERARFEYHPEDMDGFYQNQEAYHGFLLATLHEIELADLGRQVLQKRALYSTSMQALPGVPDWSPELWQRHIDVDLSQQWLYAYEGDLQVYDAPVATGRDGFNTPAGDYAVYDKYRMQTMTGSSGGETWNVPSIPWISYVVGGVAIHGTYWHNQFGTGFRLSHGCINVGMDDAEWIYQWNSIGTPVHIHY